MARPRSRWIPICTLLLVASAGLFGGCQKIFGEYQVVAEPPITLCTAGDKRCVGPFLYSCGSDLDSWVYRESCRSEAHCASREGGCLECTPGEYRCEGGSLEVCDADGAFTLAEDCGDANRCNLNSDSCRPCTAGEYQCDRERLMLCMPDQTWMVTACANEAACSVGPNRTTGNCDDPDPACTTGAVHVCNGTKLMRCTDAQKLVEVDTCENPDDEQDEQDQGPKELCDAAAADQQAANDLLGSCVMACEPNAVRCVDAAFQLCSADGTWQAMATCESANACSTKLMGCAACDPGSLECNDGELRRCTEAGWERVQDCGAARLCNEAAGKCDAGACPVAGQTSCEPDGLQECVSDQSRWRTVVFCSGDLCNANDGDCDPAACAKGAKRCWNNTLEACNSNLRGWDVLEECEASETCSLEGCAASDCQDGESRCNDIYLETCVAAAWQHADRCATPAFCDPSQPTCVPPECELGDFTCDGASLKQCKTDQTGYEDAGFCEGATPVCDANAGMCVPAP